MTAGRRIRADILRATESLYGASRANRPSDISGSPVVCPFCPGNEHTTGALLTLDPGPDWQSRVVANLYPAVIAPDGRHELIVDVRDHHAVWTAFDCDCVARILAIYREREAAAFADGFVFVSIFKNSGGPAGASLRHPHTQVIALRTLPLSIAARLERVTGVCGVCATVASGQDRIVLRTPNTVAYVPDGSRTAFEVRIAPVGHLAQFSQSADALVAEAAATLANVMKRLAATLGESIPFNLVVQSAPREPASAALMHWEIEVVPRAENFGGFELGTGGFLVSRLPQEAAAILRALPAAVSA